MHRLVGKVEQLLVEEELDQLSAVGKLTLGQLLTFRDVVPVFETGPAAGRGGVLRVVDRTPLERRLVAVPRRLRRSEVFPQPVAFRLLESTPAHSRGVVSPLHGHHPGE